MTVFMGHASHKYVKRQVSHESGMDGSSFKIHREA